MKYKNKGGNAEKLLAYIPTNILYCDQKALVRKTDDKPFNNLFKIGE